MVWNTYLNTTRLMPYRPSRAGHPLRLGRAKGLPTTLASWAHRSSSATSTPFVSSRQSTRGVPLSSSPTASESDVVITATGRERVIGAQEFPHLRDRCMLANAGHSNLEIDIPALRRYRTSSLGPALEEVDLGNRRIYLLAGGAMLNLAAGPGDPYDSFDLTSALMLAGIEFMVAHYTEYPPGIHLLPDGVEQRIATLATQSRSHNVH